MRYNIAQGDIFNKSLIIDVLLVYSLTTLTPCLKHSTMFKKKTVEIL